MNVSDYLDERVVRLRRDLALMLEDAKVAIARAERWMKDGHVPTGFVNELAQTARNAASLNDTLLELTDIAALAKATGGA